jgi:uncharacterized protein YndB with AHSA1/START domain
MSRTIRINVEYPHPPDRVWQALTTREAIAEWLMENDFEPRVGHRFTMRTEPAPGFDGIVQCELRELEPPRRMVWTWRGGPIDTTLTFELEPTPRGTRLCVRQAGFRGMKAYLVSLILGSGWRGIYRRKLPAALDRLAQSAGAARDAFSPAPVEGCESRGFWRVLVWLFGPILRHEKS